MKFNEKMGNMKESEKKMDLEQKWVKRFSSMKSH